MILQKTGLWTPSRAAALALWLVAMVSALISLLPGMNGFSAGYGIAGVLFILLLSWNIASLPPRAADLPTLDLFSTRRLPFAGMMGLLIAGIAVLLVLGLMVGPGLSILALLALAGLIISLRWWRELRRSTLGMAVLIGVIAAAGIVWLGDGDRAWALVNLVCLPFIFIAGALLVQKTGLARVRLLEGRYRQALVGFLWGCILAVPAALFNLLGNMQAGDTWLRSAWQPLYAIVPALAEETWARLFLLTLMYALLRPTAAKHPGRAVTAAIILSTLVWGFGHTGINPIGIVIGSLLYGVPAGLLLIKKDFEHAVGYHFLVDLLRWIAALMI